MSSGAPDVIRVIKKTYPTFDKYLVYNSGWKVSKGKRRRKHVKKQVIDPEEERQKNLLRNSIRAKTAIQDIVASNTFDYFITLTIAPGSTVNRYDYNSATEAITKFLRSNIEKYILVPEKHKDGAFHFHLLADLEKHQLKSTKKHSKYKSLVKYHLGFSSAVAVRPGSESRLSSYLQKYITKDLMESVPPGRKRYWVSKNLNRPKVSYNVKLPSHLTPDYLNKHLSIYNDYDLSTRQIQSVFENV